MMRKTLMRELSNVTMADLEVEREMERVGEELLKNTNIKVLKSTDEVSNFSAIVSSRGPIVIK